MLRVVYHEKYKEVYASDPAAQPGRMESIYDALKGFEFFKPKPAGEGDLKLAHGAYHIESIKRDKRLYDVAVLAVGGAIKASELALQGEPAFGLIRPPGHHASRDSCWGFCFFNNIAVAIEKLRKEKKIEKAFILDIDLHFGDGTMNILGNKPGIPILNPTSAGRGEYLDEISTCLANEAIRGYDIIAVSAGFDEYELDWGGKLKTEDYKEIGRIIKEAAEDTCNGRRFAVLEGGYYIPDLGKNVRSLLEGMM
jgi:acetoin utilization deacetylase AcuC-like enzyme